MPRQPWQRRVVACGAGAPRLGVWAAAASDELLYLGYCPGCIFRADGAVVQPRLAARQRPLLVSIPPRSAGRLQQQANTRHDRLPTRPRHGLRSEQLACMLITSSSNCMCTPLGSVLQPPLAQPPTQPDRRRHALSGWHALGHARADLG